MKAYTNNRFGSYIEDVGTLKASGGDCGGGSETLIVDTYACGVGESIKRSDVSSTLRVKEPYGGG